MASSKFWAIVGLTEMLLLPAVYAVLTHNPVMYFVGVGLHVITHFSGYSLHAAPVLLKDEEE